MLNGLLMNAAAGGVYQPTKLAEQGIGHVWWDLRDGATNKDAPGLDTFRQIVKTTGLEYGFVYTLDYVAGNGGLPQARACWDRYDKEVAMIGKKPIGLILAFLPISGKPLPTDRKDAYVNDLEYFRDEWVTHFGAGGRPIILSRRDMLSYLGTPNANLAKCPLALTDFNAIPTTSISVWNQWAFNWYAGAESNAVYSCYGQIRWPGTAAELKQWVVDRKTIPPYTPGTPPPVTTCPEGQIWDGSKCVDKPVVIPGTIEERLAKAEARLDELELIVLAKQAYIEALLAFGV